MMRALRVAGALTLTIACSTLAASAGATTGTIEGRVFDDHRRGLQDAVISIHAPSFTAQTRSDAKGHYHFLSLYPERYYIVFRRGGNQSLTSEIDVHADQITVCNAHLYVALKGLYSTRARDNRVVPCSF
jgi:protocatechuate 3,4-dioxygenase beta subunit